MTHHTLDAKDHDGSMSHLVKNGPPGRVQARSVRPPITDMKRLIRLVRFVVLLTSSGISHLPERRSSPIPNSTIPFRRRTSPFSVLVRTSAFSVLSLLK
jgi:hypothetical protein